MDPGPLLDGEDIVYSGRASALIRPSAHGLTRFAADQLLGLVAAEGFEALAGQLFLTRARIIFSSHGDNRMTGRLSTPLSVVDSYVRFRVRLARGLEVRTQVAHQRFVSWSADRAIRSLDAAKAWAGEHPAEAALWDSQLIDLLGGWEVNQTAEPLNRDAAEWVMDSRPLSQLSAIMTRLLRSGEN